MRKVNWMQQGGAPIRNDDWHYEQGSLLETLASMNRGMVAASYRLHGVELDLSGGVSWTAGAVVLDGEVYQVAAGSLAANLGHLYVEVVVTNDASGSVILENGNAADIHINRHATIATYASAQPLTEGRFDIAVLDRTMESETLYRVQHNNLHFQKRVALKVGASSFSSGTLTLEEEANVFEPEMSGQAMIENITGVAMPEGSVIYVVPVWSGKVRVMDSADIHVPSGLEWFDAGTPIVFVRSSGKWRLVTLGVEPYEWNTLGITYNSTGEIRYRKEGIWVSLDGWAELDVAVTSPPFVLFNLPAGFRPAQAQPLVVHAWRESDNTHFKVLVTIYPSGAVDIDEALSIYPSKVYFSNVRYSVE